MWASLAPWVEIVDKNAVKVSVLIHDGSTHTKKNMHVTTSYLVGRQRADI